MRRSVTGNLRLAATAAGILCCAAASEAQELAIAPRITVIEGDSGNVGWNIQVTTTGPNPLQSVSWRTLAGSASGGSDFVVVSSGTVSWPTDDLPKNITVFIAGDFTAEWNSTEQQDEVFFVELFNPVSATIRSGRSTVTIIDNDTPQPGAQYLSAVTDSTGALATDGRNRLQWRVPAAPSSPTQFEVCWKATLPGTACASPTSNTDTAGGACAPLINGPFTAGAKLLFTHDNMSVVKVNVPMNYCYSVFTKYPGTSPERAEVAVRTFDSTNGPLKWALSEGHYNGAPTASLAPPTVGQHGVYAVGTDGVVLAMQRGPVGGLWPVGWNPLALGKPTQNRSAAIPMANSSRLLLGTDEGGLHALDGQTGAILWSRSQKFLNALPFVLGGVQAQPAALLKAFGGNNDMVLVGTNAGASNRFYALDAQTGNDQGTFYAHAQLGNVTGQAVVDYANNNVFFLTSNPTGALFGLDMGGSGAPNLTLDTGLAFSNPKTLPYGSSGSPVLRNNHLLWGDSFSSVWGLDITTDTPYSAGTGDGPVKGFVWPDRRDTRIYFATNGKVQCLQDNGGSFSGCPGSWPVGVTSPSMLLQKPGTDFIYVGDSQGNLVQIKVSDQSQLPLLLDSGVQIGPPSLDGPNNLLLVGSSSGRIFAVQVPY